MSRPTVDIYCQIKHETDNAILIDEGDKTVWIPLSQVEEIPRKKDGYATVVMSEWIATQKGII